jgi:hypothetical protein
MDRTILAAVRDAIDNAGYDAGAQERLTACLPMLLAAIDDSHRMPCPLAIAAATRRSAVVLCAARWPEVPGTRQGLTEITDFLAKKVESKVTVPNAILTGMAALLGHAGMPLNSRMPKGSRQKGKGH